MRQDETGRWVSDDGRYVWDGTTWLDEAAGAPAAAQQAPTRDAAAAASAGAAAPAAPGAHSRRRAGRSGTPSGTPSGGTGSLENPSIGTPSTGTPPTGAEPRRRRRRSLVLLLVVVVLAAGGTGAVLLLGHDTTRRTAPTATDTPAATTSPDAAAPTAPSGAVLAEPQRRQRAESALLQRAEVLGTTEQRPANPTDVFLPCQAPALVPPPGSVIVGQTLSNTDFSVYAGQTVAGFPTVAAAADALADVRRHLAACQPYDFRYVNSDRFDRITFAAADPALALGDGGVYLAETDTPGNYNGSPTTYSYGYVQQGQFLVRLTLTNNAAADRPGLELLLRRTLNRLR